MKPPLVCVDASVAVKWVLVEEESETALGLLEQWRQQEKELIAPPHLPIEVANAIYQRARRRDLTIAQARAALKKFLKVRVSLVTTARLYEGTFRIAQQLQLPSLYDAHYLALARLSRCEFWTADEHLYVAVHRKLSWMKRIGID